MSQYKVDSNIPIPLDSNAKRGPHAKGYSKFPIRDMQVGDSFFAPGYTPRSIASGLYAATKRRAREEFQGPMQRHHKQSDEVNGVKGTRVWRIE